ncbi:hypothetical protein [Pseudoalteromonas phenolica]|uniref:hypothetical protein n=1 Tax=Pseudoalteromonas phenolica TaxID=161398 RepID=UPI00110BBFFB|nr:hypothetical protein [Pseudoalteromonas phenolica]TMO56993.1 hypothetical protein CWC21_03640 [Pseudoalteromonas phenolica]
MVQKNRQSNLRLSELKLPKTFTAQSGLVVNVFEDRWQLAPTGKGNSINVAFLHSFKCDSILKLAVFDTLIHYAQTKSASTVSTQLAALKQSFPSDLEDIDEFKIRWNSLGDSAKKTLKGFLSTAVNNLSHSNLIKYYTIASKYNHKTKFNALCSKKGRLTDYEYDSILQNVRFLCNEIEIIKNEGLDFYQRKNSLPNKNFFSHIKSVMAYRLILQIARRPKQITLLKWCDLLPVGVSFNDENILSEPTFTGINHLHIRSFKIKQSKSENTFRYMPERWSIPLSQSFTELILKYREIYLRGISLNLKKLGIKEFNKEASKLLFHCPIIPDNEIFSANLVSKQLREQLESDNSSLFHISESVLNSYMLTHGRGLSERHGIVHGTNNRLRHTWLCNAAIEGKSLIDISKITNVTLPAARSYLKLGLKERQFIDENYAANELLREAFNPIETVNGSDSLILNDIGCTIGVEKNEKTCVGCEHKARMARPIACYGCENFRPFLDGDHASILFQAEAKCDFLKKYKSGNTKSGSLKRIEKAIRYIKLTIAICDEKKRFQDGLKEHYEDV